MGVMLQQAIVQSQARLADEECAAYQALVLLKKFSGVVKLNVLPERNVLGLSNGRGGK